MNKLGCGLLIWTLICSSLLAEPPIEIGTSAAGNYEARNLFNNPAAIGFEKELNGSQVLGSFSHGLNDSLSNEYSIALSWGILGAGAEKLYDFTQADFLSRYQLALGFSLSPKLYLGSRYRFTRSDNLSLDHLNSWDLGFQFRPVDFFALGLVTNGLNQPIINGKASPITYNAGILLRPLSALDLSFDIYGDSKSSRNLTWMTSALVHVGRGLSFRAGYHEKNLGHIGFQWSLGGFTAHSELQPSQSYRRAIWGVQLAPRPIRTAAFPRQALLIKIDSSLQEEAEAGTLISKSKPSLLNLLKELKEAEIRDDVRLILVKIDDFDLGYGAAEEIFEALQRVKKRGKRVEALLGQADLKEYFIASAAHQITLEPAGELRLQRLRSERFYAKGTLDKIGVEGQFFARGDYKSAPEMFTRKEASPKSRASTLEFIRAAELELKSSILSARNLSEAKWNEALNLALLSPEEALKLQLVDRVESISAKLKEWESRYTLRENISQDRRVDLALPTRIAVVTVDGDILQKRFRSLSLAGRSQITPERSEKLLKKALADERTQGIIFRVNSGGGEVLASQEIASLIQNASLEKPVWISMGDVAASGGYYLAAPAQKIFADKLTVTGSIGVFLGKFSLEKLYEKIDLKKEILTESPYPSLFSESRPWNAKEQEIMRRRLNAYYDSFVQFVAHHRNISREKAEDSAQGRVWLGKQAKERNLVDVEGGVIDAATQMASTLKLNADFEIWSVESDAGLFEVLADSPMAYASERANPLLEARWLQDLERMASWQKDPILYWAPTQLAE